MEKSYQPNDELSKFPKATVSGTVVVKLVGEFIRDCQDQI